jgi:hypothetical protein
VHACARVCVCVFACSQFIYQKNGLYVSASTILNTVETLKKKKG